MDSGRPHPYRPTSCLPANGASGSRLRFPSEPSAARESWAPQSVASDAAAASNPAAAEASQMLASMLRRSLDDARCNPSVREHLEQLARDSERVDAIVRALGPRHALVRDLSRLRDRAGSTG